MYLQYSEGKHPVKEERNNKIEEVQKNIKKIWPMR